MILFGPSESELSSAEHLEILPIGYRRMKPSDLDQLKELVALIESTSDESDKRVAIEWLADLTGDSDEAWEMFLKICRSKDRTERLRAAETIGLHWYWSPDLYDKRRAQVSEVVLRLLDDEDYYVQQAVLFRVRYLPESVQKTLLKELRVIIESTSDESDKRVAIGWLADLSRNSDEAWEIFLKVCQSPDPSVRRRAAETIGRYWPPDTYDKRAVRLSELVLRLFDDEDDILFEELCIMGPTTFRRAYGSLFTALPLPYSTRERNGTGEIMMLLQN